MLAFLGNQEKSIDREQELTEQGWEDCPKSRSTTLCRFSFFTCTRIVKIRKVWENHTSENKEDWHSTKRSKCCLCVEEERSEWEWGGVSRRIFHSGHLAIFFFCSAGGRTRIGHASKDSSDSICSCLLLHPFRKHYEPLPSFSLLQLVFCCWLMLPLLAIPFFGGYTYTSSSIANIVVMIFHVSCGFSNKQVNSSSQLKN